MAEKLSPAPSVAGLVETWRTRAKTDMRYGVSRPLKSHREHFGTVNAALSIAECADELEAALTAGGWQPLAMCPREVTRAILLYPAFKLDDDGDLTTEPAGEPLVTVGYRNVNGGWEEIDPTLEATGDFFGDNWEYGDATHFQLLPSAPTETKKS